MACCLSCHVQRRMEPGPASKSLWRCRATKACASAYTRQGSRPGCSRQTSQTSLRCHSGKALLCSNFCHTCGGAA